MEQRVTTSKVFEALRKTTEEIVVLEGSSRSTKTYSLVQFLIANALENENSKNRKSRRVAIVRSRLTWLKKTVFVDFENIMSNQFGLWDESCMNRTQFYYKLGMTTFVFTGVDREQGQSFHGEKNDDVWFNEATELDWPSVSQIMLRMTGRVFLDYNPNMNENHWIEKKIKQRESVCIIHSTYLDNPFLEDRVVREIEGYKPTPENIARGTADETMWKIYGLGVRAQIQGLVYPQYQIVKELPTGKEYFYGIDFGYSSDPTAMIKACIHDGGLYVEEKLYERGLTNIENPSNLSQPSIERRLAEIGVNAKDVIGADSAEPKTIQDLKNCGYNIHGAKKGPNSIVDGITAVKRYKLFVVEGSTNLINELTRYKWAENRDGSATNRPVSGNDHLMDDLRYSIAVHDEMTEHGGYAYDSVKPRYRLLEY